MSPHSSSFIWDFFWLWNPPSPTYLLTVLPSIIIIPFHILNLALESLRTSYIQYIHHLIVHNIKRVIQPNPFPSSENGWNEGFCCSFTVNSAYYGTNLMSVYIIWIIKVQLVAGQRKGSSAARQPACIKGFFYPLLLYPGGLGKLCSSSAETRWLTFTSKEYYSTNACTVLSLVVCHIRTSSTGNLVFFLGPN